METEEALALLDELLAHSTESRFEYRHRWKAGDTVIWNNRCLLHKANGDYSRRAGPLSLSSHAEGREARVTRLPPGQDHWARRRPVTPICCAA
jgi:Taurine catabolism dioxygenase TauD, TfdA family